jgi:16S rRNA (guanine966-N2)-methyltransferase
MRIIGGAFRGKKIEFVCDAQTRPTTDRVKENIFNILQNKIDMQNARVLDLFAGTGQMGIECLSRGAGKVFFVDSRPEMGKIIEKNAPKVPDFVPKSVPKHPFGARFCHVFVQESGVFLKSYCTEKFDIVFIDPPYDKPELATEAVKVLFENKMIESHSVIVVESEDMNLQFENFEIDKRKYGRATIYFLHMMN